MSVRDLLALPGTYVLLMHAGGRRSLTVGRLGRLDLRPGWYAYVGSALGPGGVRARVRRHLRASRRPHWHLDAVLPHVRVVGLWVGYGSERRECAWAAALAALPGVEVPLPGFGASDCRCRAHLFRLAAAPLPGTPAGEALGRGPGGPVYLSAEALREHGA